mmetsp:Transcript_14535/g.27627  ORF Transcript_14535/g.27627 Transcript_14535/m.27627 type:complete len:296 (+) Transcript_14535:164-1051(+)|eukprot:scaffold34619_cov183-Amphora_coffeaeformis.AAC.7
MASCTPNMNTSSTTKTNESPSTVQTDGTTGYRDFANEVEVPGGSVVSHTKNGANSEQNFPVKLHYMLSDMEADGLANIVSWQPHGRCFIVHETEEFVSKILPLWFRQTKISSFQRQLNLYGFKRITAGPDKGAHYHELFLRNKRHLAHRIHRMKIKGKGARKPAKPESEPNFYEKPFLPAHSAPKTITTITNHPMASTPTNPMALGGPFPSIYAQLLQSSALAAAAAAYHQQQQQHHHHAAGAHITTGPSALDQLLTQCPTWVPPSLANTLPPQVLSSLMMEGMEAAALLNQFRG